MARRARPVTSDWGDPGGWPTSEPDDRGAPDHGAQPDHPSPHRCLARVVALLDRLEPGTTELMVHPGHPDGDLAGWDDYTTPRAAELAALTSSVVRARFASGAFRLVHFGAL